MEDHVIEQASQQGCGRDLVAAMKMNKGEKRRLDEDV